MQVYALWHGGSNYSYGGPEYVERFDSIREAVDALRDRANNGHWEPQTFRYVHRAPESALTPCVDSGAYVDLYLSDPTEVWHDGSVMWRELDIMPDRRYEIGPRGGVARVSV